MVGTGGIVFLVGGGAMAVGFGFATGWTLTAMTESRDAVAANVSPSMPPPLPQFPPILPPSPPSTGRRLLSALPEGAHSQHKVAFSSDEVEQLRQVAKLIVRDRR